MQGAPEKITISLVDQLNKVRNEEIAKAPFLFTRMRQDVAKLREISVSDADMILGIIASLEGDEAEMRKRHKNAIRHKPYSEQFSSNYGVSLAYLLYLDEAAKHEYDAFLKSNKKSINRLREAISFFLFAGLVQDSFRLIEENSGLLQKFEHAGAMRMVKSLVDAARVGNFDLDSFNVKMATVHEKMRQKGVRNISREVSFEETDNETWWRLYLKAPLEAGEIVELENEINDELHGKGCESLEDGFAEVFIETEDDDYHKLLRHMDDNISVEDMVVLNDELFKKMEKALR